MQDQPNDLDGRVTGLDASVARLTSEVTSLKLELATLVSAIRDLQRQGGPQKAPPRHLLPAIESSIKPSFVPGAVVVALAVGLLAWQVVVTPRVVQSAGQPAPSASVAGAPTQASTTGEQPAPGAELSSALPAVYRGTLTIRADHPGAHVYVNREPVGIAPVRVRNLRAGAHLVWVESEGYRRWTRVVTVPAEQVTRVAADLEPIDMQQHAAVAEPQR